MLFFIKKKRCSTGVWGCGVENRYLLFIKTNDSAIQIINQSFLLTEIYNVCNIQM